MSPLRLILNPKWCSPTLITWITKSLSVSPVLDRMVLHTCTITVVFLSALTQSTNVSVRILFTSTGVTFDKRHGSLFLIFASFIPLCHSNTISAYVDEIKNCLSSEVLAINSSLDYWLEKMCIHILENILNYNWDIYFASFISFTVELMSWGF